MFLSDDAVGQICDSDVACVTHLVARARANYARAKRACVHVF